MGVPLLCIHLTDKFKVTDLASTAEIVVTRTYRPLPQNLNALLGLCDMLKA